MYLPVQKTAADVAPPLNDGRTVGEVEGAWIVARTKPHHERLYAWDLLRISRYTGGAVGFLLPMETYKVGSANEVRRTYHRPLFPGTIFICIVDNGLNIDPNQRTFPQFVIRPPNGAQQRLREDLTRVEIGALNDAYRLNPYPFAKPGTKVRICNGPFQGQIGPVKYADGGERKFIIEVVLLGALTSYTLEDHIEIEPVE